MRDQREAARLRHVRGKAGIQIDPGHHDAEAVRPDQPHAVFAGGCDCSLVQRSRTVAEPGRDDQRTRRSTTPGLVDDTRNLARRRGDDHELGHEVQAVQAFHRGDAADFGMAWIDEAELPLEPGLVNVLQNGASDGDRTGARADECN